MNAPNCPLCGAEMIASFGHTRCANINCPLMGLFSDDEIARLCNPNPWRPIAEVPRDNRLVEEWQGGRVYGPTIATNRTWKASHWRNYTPPPKPQPPQLEEWEVEWNKLTTLPEAKELYRVVYQSAMKAKEGK